MESGGDVKFYSPGAPIRPHFSFSHQFSSLRADGGTWAEKFHRLTPYPERTLFCYTEYFLKISWIFGRDKTSARVHPRFPLWERDVKHYTWWEKIIYNFRFIYLFFPEGVLKVGQCFYFYCCFYNNKQSNWYEASNEGLWLVDAWPSLRSLVQSTRFAN